MIAISLKMLAGRLHATPWGRHVNEGAAEWPPTPWRLLRSMIATWKGKNLSIDDDTAERILRAISSPPDYALPPATVSHTRHYMPWDKNNAGDTTLIFDTFVAVDPNSLVIIRWPDAELSEDDQQVLADWLRHVGYLGRAESWCEMSLVPSDLITDAQTPTNCHPEINEPLPSPSAESSTEKISVLCLDPDTAFADTHTPKTITSTGSGKSKVTTITPHYDPDWHLCGETGWLDKERWADPPGSRWVSYRRPSNCFQVRPKRRVAVIENPQARPQVARFALDSTVLPLVTETLPVAESARSALMSLFGRHAERTTGEKGRSEIFSGKLSDGSIRTDHQHAYFLPTDDDGDGRLDHLTVIAELGFGRDELRALNSLNKLYQRKRPDDGPFHPLFTLLTGLGRLDDFQPSVVSPTSTWKSATPYLAHRHPKRRGSKRDSPEELASPQAFLTARLREDIKRLIQRRPDLSHLSGDEIEIKPNDGNRGVFEIGKRKLRPIEFKRYRRKRSDDGGKRLSGAFEITFPEEIPGPIALGHSCHFGMGLFLPR